jgi:uncharacterized SAM-binding protein YcdF (DUF218 family)
MSRRLLSQPCSNQPRFNQPHFKQRERGGIIFRLLSLLLFVLLLAAVYAVRYPLMRMAGRLWVVSDPAEHADAILVIGDDDYTGDRAARAAELYRSGWAPIIVASGRRLRPYAGIAELIEHDIEGHGVPPTSVIRFAQDADNTLDEAKALRQLVADRHWRHLLLVTSNYHTRRAGYIFRKVLPADVSLDVISAPDANFDPDYWWQSRKGQELFLHEIFGYPLAVWELRSETGAN